MLIGVVALILAGFPLVLAIRNLAVYRTPPRCPGRPTLSVLIPARNEERNIGPCVDAVLASGGVELELWVLDDHSTDATRTILAGISDPRVSVAAAPPLPTGWSGKQHACAVLATHARHELMVFIDADVRLAPDALSRIAGAMAEHDWGLASGFPRQVVCTWAERLLLPLIHVLLLGYLPMHIAQRLANPGLGAACGQLIVCRRGDYDRAGGHAAIRSSLHDGLTLPRAFRRVGIMTGLFDASRLASCRMYHGAAEVWEGLGKNATEGMARPAALPVWTALLAGGHILPFVLMIVAPGPVPMAAVACSLGLRLLLALRFRQPLEGVLLHPFSVLALLARQWTALAHAAGGRPSVWRGRSYPAA